MDRKEYSISALKGLRAGIQRHLRNPPFHRTVNLSKESVFHQANQILNAREKLKGEDHGPRTHHVIDAKDMQKMYDSKVLSDDTPQGLQNKVFFEMALHFDTKSRGKFRDLTIDSFEFHQDPEKGKYVTLREKANEKLLAHEEAKKQRLYATGRPNCPVASLEKYIRLLNPKSPCFFQAYHGSPYEKKGDRCSNWYNGQPIGKNTLGAMMKKISVDAKLSRSYTNLSIHLTSMEFRKARLKEEFCSFDQFMLQNAT